MGSRHYADSTITAQRVSDIPDIKFSDRVEECLTVEQKK